MYKKLALFGVFLALIVIVFGAYARLSDAGLGCPDWPGCYGKAMIDDTPDFKAEADRAFPEHPFVYEKAWKEMTHRYLTAGLGLVILLLAILSPWVKTNRLAAVSSSFVLLILVGLQAALGMWTVQLKTMPLIVTAHLLLGMFTFWLLNGLYLRVKPEFTRLPARQGPVWTARFAMGVVFLQTLLGGWTSANLAALACGSDLPLCNGQWFPGAADFNGAMNLLQGLTTGYTGVLPPDAQVAAHWLHRVFALVSFVVLSLVMLLATAAKNPKPVRRAGLKICILLIVQIGLGIVIVKLTAPLWAAVLHNAFAALMMMPLISISFYGRFGPKEAEIPAERTRPLPEEKEVKKVSVEKAAEEVYVEPAPESLYLRLKSQLKRTRSGLGDALANLSFGQKGVSDDLLEDIEATLLMADIGIDATSRIISHLTQSLERHQLRDADILISAVKQELLAIVEPCCEPLQIPKQDNPFVILVVGVNGVGKTTTIGKLAKRLQAQGHSVMLAAGDTFRAAAVEQLQTWGDRNNIHVVAQHTGADSASVIYDGLQSAKAKGIDVLIADTAGRLHTKSNLMEELKKVKRIMGKIDQTAPHEVLLVIDAGTGQNALSQAKQFNDAVALTGLVLTKLDGTAKGGMIFALAKQIGIPIRFIGVGEGIDDLQDFHADAFVEALFAKD
ncbi:signal recognition particle-docking protein FtsY [Methylomicrobium sp. Wu6]|uniref:signal recognition particle-docking protein FtsY n=1 Tax=Methylomicrobium sp. Wu6 TaxID=3107928 RepID=UPI002DD6493D|nr:signal recognition particle-docking protein FtsY [Methylomicrobium sp. Wu6]MEC4747700.1 signal recognition particle-docking protein FtsY [Methylomicrobium sp. Wu6]